VLLVAGRQPIGVLLAGRQPISVLLAGKIFFRMQFIVSGEKLRIIL
jgi:hypothetical protein